MRNGNNRRPAWKAMIALVAAAVALAGGASAVSSRRLEQATQIRLCLPDPASNVGACTNALSGIGGGRFSCIASAGLDDCIAKMNNGEAELTVMNGGELYAAHQEHDFAPLIGEKNGNDVGLSYYAVAVVRSDSSLCGGNGFADLQGKNVCSTGYRKTAGWFMPMGYLVGSGHMPIVSTDPSVNADAESAASFFGQMCAPRVTSAGPAFVGGTATNYSPLCELCDDAPNGNGCAEDSNYADYLGAFRGLYDGVCDAAFVKHLTVLQDAEQESWFTAEEKSDFSILCPRSGQCVSVENYADCAIARNAARSIVGTPTLSETDAQAIRTAFVSLSGANLATIRTEVFESSDSPNYALGAITGNFLDFFSEGAVAAYEGFELLEAADEGVKLCLPYEATDSEVAQCTAQLSSARGYLSCVRGGSVSACTDMINAGQATLTAMNGGDLYQANRDHGFTPIVAERSSDGFANQIGLSYYATAIVPADSDLCGAGGFSALEGRNACSTGYRKTAGWFMPTGYMVGSGIMPVVNRDKKVNADAESFASFFGGVCAPRVTGEGPAFVSEEEGAETTSYAPLCELCSKGPNGNGCEEESNYADYLGAFRGLHDGVCDVAFVKHTTVPKDALKADWFSSSGKTPADYKILCRTDGRCADVDEPSAYDECAIARNASRAIVAPKGMGDALKSDIQAAFSSPNASFLNTVRETVFRSDPSDTYELGAVTGDFSDYFSEGAIAAFKGFEVLESSARFDAEGGSSGGGLSSGAVAGVAIACIIGGAAIGGGVFMYRRYKKTKGNGFNEDNTAYGARNGVHITGVGDAKEHSRDAVYTASRQPAPPTQPPMHAQPGAQL